MMSEENWEAAQICFEHSIPPIRQVQRICRSYQSGIEQMINTKQQELIHEMLETVRERFPEVKLLSVTESPENSNDLWINVTAPEDEDREIELMEFTSDKEADKLSWPFILVDYGYRIAVMPTKVIIAQN